MVDVVSRVDIRRGAPMSDADNTLAKNAQEHAAPVEKSANSSSELFNLASVNSVRNRVPSCVLAEEQEKISASDYPDLDIKTVTDAIKAPIEAVKDTGWHIGKVVVNSFEANLLKVKAARERLIKSEQTIFQKVWEFICSPFKSDKFEDIDVLMAQLLADIEGKSPEEKCCIIKEFYTNTRELIDLPEAAGMFGSSTRFRKLNASKVKNITREFSKTRSFTKKLAMNVMNNSDEKEMMLLAALDDVENGQENLKELVFKYLPEGMTERQVQEVFDALGDYAFLQSADIKSAIAQGNFRGKFKEYVVQKAKEVVAAASRRVRAYIAQFFETAKGRTVKRIVNRAYEKTQEAKKEFLERKEVTKAAIEEAQEAKKQSEVAIEKVKEEEAKARSFAERFGYKYMDNDRLYNFVKHQSPLMAHNLLYAQANKKKAYWEAYDAKVAQEHAEFLEKMALNRFEYENIKMEATFAQMLILLNTQFD
ncbi:MAG: hypothetical protein K6A44_06915 [bacterium]|nr:hypothetical protein [bacterium]